MGREVPRLDRLPEVEPPPAVRLRRGSEGFEVRPVVVEPPSGESEWEEGYVSEGELDEDGDRRPSGPRYRVYEREPASASSDEFDSSESESEED